MPVERFTMYGPQGQEATTTADAYEAIWFEKGWRKSKPAAKKAPAPEPESSDEG